MIQQSPQMAPAPRPTASIAVLRCVDQFTMDATPLSVIFSELPEHEAEDIVCRALEDVAARLDALQSARRSGALDEICVPARRIAAIARGIGLTEVATAASHVGTGAEAGNGVAVGATMARLERAFDTAVSHVWDFRDYG